ncbi:hydrogenase formation protein HypD [Dictyobacter kobayashii]|uniref:Uncharacterized protein n=1 Tax=Dictyobacter kobayashii TaxID=2014872 RepID=A0A402AKG0_9CHLR|nr:hydrogenase formation protein HypD [Dictyobacter kobayashii]GCE19573.1 hypothetical protein KDK_33730 [Dictyobacter kobayashii]
MAETFVAKGALHRKYSWKRQIYYGLLEVIRLLRRQPEEKVVFLAIEPH